jgi:hypothetical protein
MQILIATPVTTEKSHSIRRSDTEQMSSAARFSFLMLRMLPVTI